MKKKLQNTFATPLQKHRARFNSAAQKTRLSGWVCVGHKKAQRTGLFITISMV